MAQWPLPAKLVSWISLLSEPLHARVARRLEPLFCGILFAQGRQTVASWLRAAALGEDFQRYYYFLGGLGRKCKEVADPLFRLVVATVVPGDRLLVALDDTPTKRFGKKVEAAGIHHNPTPGPADQKFLYGHVWVVLAAVVRHPIFGTIGLPLRAALYTRRKDIATLPKRYKVSFATKLELAAQLVAWAAFWLKCVDKSLWVVADGAYAKRPFLRAVMARGATVVSRLRKDAALRSVPKPQKQRRGRPRIYGEHAISLAKRAAQKGGWTTEQFLLYGKKHTKTYKSFLATYRPAGGLIRVVLVKESDGWVAFFCTDPEASVETILEAVADRAAIEQVFHDIKEVHGAGKQQLRHYWANVAAFHLNMWTHTLIELWAWDKPHKDLCDRSQSPWDDPTRRPSHADRRNALRRQCIDNEFLDAQSSKPIAQKIRTLFQRLASMVL